MDEITVTEGDFRHRASFKSAHFRKAASFRATFQHEANFYAAEFQKADFAYSKWHGVTSFETAKFALEAKFRGAIFYKPVTFLYAEFSDRIDATDVQFHDEATFDGAQFLGPAVFAGKAAFLQVVTFRGSRFGKVADFSNCTFHDTTEFGAAKFVGPPKFDGTTLHTDTSFLGARFHRGAAPIDPCWIARDGGSGSRVEKVLAALFATYQRILITLRWLPFFTLRWPAMGTIRGERDQATRRYERSYSVLRQLCSKIGDTEQQTKFQALELQAHRARSDARLSDRVASLLYAVISNYGQSLALPIMWLTTAWVAIVCLYFLLFMPPYPTGPADVACDSATLLSPEFTERLEEVAVAVGRQFLPSLFGSGTGAGAPPGWLRCASASRPLWFFLVGMFQTVLFVTCISLFLVALRRRFKLRD
jgi:uncharacterized protein YjbI with pentapeptide repeats